MFFIRNTYFDLNKVPPLLLFYLPLPPLSPLNYSFYHKRHKHSFFIKHSSPSVYSCPSNVACMRTAGWNVMVGGLCSGELQPLTLDRESGTALDNVSSFPRAADELEILGVISWFLRVDFHSRSLHTGLVKQQCHCRYLRDLHTQIRV